MPRIQWCSRHRSQFEDISVTPRERPRGSAATPQGPGGPRSTVPVDLPVVHTAYQWERRLWAPVPSAAGGARLRCRQGPLPLLAGDLAARAGRPCMTPAHPLSSPRTLGRCLLLVVEGDATAHRSVEMSV